MNVNPEHYVARQAYLRVTGPGILENQMDNFANASFAPDLIAAMQKALEGAVSTLPHPVSSGHIKSIAETILRSAYEGERDPNTLQTMALLELQISPKR